MPFHSVFPITTSALSPIVVDGDKLVCCSKSNRLRKDSSFTEGSCDKNLYSCLKDKNRSMMFTGEFSSLSKEFPQSQLIFLIFWVDNISNQLLLTSPLFKVRHF
jgi:hypothetical protein